jgi:hypothetical protein
MDSKKPLTKRDFEMLMNEISMIKNIFQNNIEFQNTKKQSNNIFEEINSKKFDGNKNEP